MWLGNVDFFLLSGACRLWSKDPDGLRQPVGVSVVVLEELE